MNNPSYPLIVEPTFRTMPTVGGPDCPLRLDILERLSGMFADMLGEHPEAVFLNFVLRYPPSGAVPQGNQIFLDWLHRYALLMRGSGYAMHYAWSRDQEPEEGRYRHGVVVLAANSSGLSATDCTTLADELWRGWIWRMPAGAAMFLPGPENGTVLRFADSNSFGNGLPRCFQAATAIAKAQPKCREHGCAHNFGSSRVVM